MPPAILSAALNSATPTSSAPVRTLRGSRTKRATASTTAASTKSPPASTSSLLARRRPFRWEKWELDVLRDYFDSKNRTPGPAERSSLARTLVEMRTARGGAPLRQRSVREKEEEVSEYERGLANWFKNRRALEKRHGQRRTREIDKTKEEVVMEEKGEDDGRNGGTEQWPLPSATRGMLQDGRETSEYYYPVVVNSVSDGSSIGISWRRTEYQRCYDGQYDDETWETCSCCPRGKDEAVTEEVHDGGDVPDRIWTTDDKTWGAFPGGDNGRAAVAVAMGAAEEWKDAVEPSSYCAVGASGFVFSRGVLAESYERCKVAV